jgi:hypothetical protein
MSNHAGKGDEERDAVDRPAFRKAHERIFGKRDLPRVARKTRQVYCAHKGKS